MRFFMQSFLIFILLLPLYAATTSSYIAVGSFKTKARAEVQRQMLEETMEGQDHIVGLKKDNDFEYIVRKAGSYNIVAIGPFEQRDVLLTVLKTARKTFPDAYERTLISEKKVSETALPAEVKTGVSSTEPKDVVPVAKIEPKNVSVSKPQSAAPEGEADAPDAADDEVIALETVEIVTIMEPEKTAEPVSKPVSKSIPNDNFMGLSDMMLYAAAAAVIVILLIVMFMLRSKKETKEEEPITEDTKSGPLDMETPLGEDEVAEGEAIEMPVEYPKQTQPVLPEAEVHEEIVKPAVPEPPIAPIGKVEKPPVSLRKKREPNPNRGKVSKENLVEFSGNRILVAEDNLINQKVITSLLAGSGMEIVIANNGQEALDILEQDSNFQMILMDAHMPVKDGFQASQDIRDNPKYDNIAIIALSGDTSADDVKKMKKAGMEEHLAKPLRIEALYDVMYSYFDIDIPESEEKQDSDLLRNTEALNAEEGLEISGGDIELYKEILTEFVQTYGDSDDMLNGYFVHDDAEAAKSLLLDIRGIAANIGAKQLSDTAEELREAILDNIEVKYNALFEKYREQLAALLNDIKKI